MLSTSVVPIFQAVLPNGKVLMWDSVGEKAPEQMPTNNFTRAMVWDPTNNTYKQTNVPNYNIFCAGYTQLADGNVLVAGGNKNAALDGIVQTHLFKWKTETWSRGPDMAAARWYPAVQALGNNEAVIVGGGAAVPEVYQTDTTLRKLSNASGYSDRLYPFLTTRPDGQVELMGPVTQMNTIDTSGTGAITATTARDGINRTYGGFATYDIGKVLVAGGGDITEGSAHVPTKTARIVDVNGGGKPTVTDAGSMSVGRRQHSLTILADGSVLATGGMSKATNANVDLNNPVFAAERWVPPTGHRARDVDSFIQRQTRPPIPLQRHPATRRSGTYRRRRSLCFLRHRGISGEEHRVLRTALPLQTRWQQGEPASDRQGARYRYL